MGDDDNDVSADAGRPGGSDSGGGDHADDGDVEDNVDAGGENDADAAAAHRRGRVAGSS